MRLALSLLGLSAFLVVPSVAIAGDDAAELAVKFVEQMAVIVDADKADCDRMGSDLSAFVDRNADTLKRLREADAKMTPAQKKEIETKYKGRLDAAALKMQAGMMKCATNAKVAAAIGKMK